MEEYKTLSQLLGFVNGKFSNPTAFNDKIDGSWCEISHRQFYDKVKHICLGLMKIGVSKGDTVAIVSNSNTTWLAVDLAIITLGAISVPMFPNSSIKNTKYELKDADVKYVFLAAEEKFEFFDSTHDSFNRVITHRTTKSDKDEFLEFSDLLKLGTQKDLEDPTLFENLINETKADDLVTIIYTSGSTGIPKGVKLSHNNLISQIKSIVKVIDVKPEDFALSFLPTAHIFERMIVYYYLRTGASVYFTPDVKLIGEIVKEVRPTIMTAVPRFLEKVYNKMKKKVKTSSFIKKSIGELAFRRAITKDPKSKKTLADLLYDKLVYSKLRQALGGRFDLLIAGGSALADTTYVFFTNIGIPLFPGYGLTEFSPVISSCHPKSWKRGTVGQPIPGVEVKISSSGEILARGESVMQGYHNKPEETAKVIDQDGFLHTGDKGEIDSDGFIKITGRIKEMFKSSTGEYVSPIPIEERLTKHELFDMAMIVAEGRKYPSCLLFPDFDNIEYLKEKRKLSTLSDSEFLKSERVLNETSNYIEKINKRLNHWEQLHDFRIVEKPLSIENNELTPKLSLRRDSICENHIDIINEMYPNEE